MVAWLAGPRGWQVEVIPTGSLSLDHALGVGGLPRGRVVEVRMRRFGPLVSRGRRETRGSPVAHVSRARGGGLVPQNPCAIAPVSARASSGSSSVLDQEPGRHLIQTLEHSDSARVRGYVSRGRDRGSHRVRGTSPSGKSPRLGREAKPGGGIGPAWLACAGDRPPMTPSASFLCPPPADLRPRELRQDDGRAPRGGPVPEDG